MSGVVFNALLANMATSVSLLVWHHERGVALLANRALAVVDDEFNNVVELAQVSVACAPYEVPLWTAVLVAVPTPLALHDNVDHFATKNNTQCVPVRWRRVRMCAYV
jgi:hypothetical protein